MAPGGFPSHIPDRMQVVYIDNPIYIVPSKEIEELQKLLAIKDQEVKNLRTEVFRLRNELHSRRRK